jgi:hypothetical protein
MVLMEILPALAMVRIPAKWSTGSSGRHAPDSLVAMDRITHDGTVKKTYLVFQT